MENKIVLLNNLKNIRLEKKISQSALAEAVGVSRNTISSIETGQYSPTAKLAYTLCIVLDKKFEEVFYFDGFTSAALVGDRADTEICESDPSSLSNKAIQRIKEYMTKSGWSAEQILDFLMYIIA